RRHPHLDTAPWVRGGELLKGESHRRGEQRALEPVPLLPPGLQGGSAGVDADSAARGHRVPYWAANRGPMSTTMSSVTIPAATTRTPRRRVCRRERSSGGRCW